jgi:hypothetical protein
VAGFCVVEKERAVGSDRPVYLWPLRPDWLRPVPRNQRPPDWDYRIPGELSARRLAGSGRVPSDPGDVVVYTYADLPDGWPCGIGPVEVCLAQVGLQNKMDSFLKAFFDHGAMPVYGLIPKIDPNGGFGQAEADAMKAAWANKYGGIGRGAEPAVLVSVEDVKRLSFDFDELAWTDLRDLSDLAICQAFGVHPAMVGTRAGLEHSDSRANAAEARRAFYEDTVVPLWDRFDGFTTIGLLPEFDQRPTTVLRFDTSDVPALQENRNARAGWVVQATLGGAMTVHAMHRELGLPEPEGEDFYLRTLAQSAVPADDPLEEREPPAAAPPAQPPPTMPMDDDDEGRSAWRVITLNGHGPSERRAAIGLANRTAIGRVADRATPLYRAFWRSQGQRIAAAAVRSSQTVVAAHNGNGHERRDLAEIDWDDETRRLLEVLTRNHQLAAAAAITAANDALGTSIAFDLANPHLRRVIDQLAARVVGISAQTRADVAGVVSDALTEGVDLPELSRRLTGLFEESYRNRAMTVARTESQVAFNSASTVGYRESGLVDRVELHDNPEHTDDYGASDGLSCAERNGLIVPIDQASTHIEAEHPNGSLSLAPVLIGDA